MIPVVHLAAVPDELEAANHFADGEEAEALGEQDAAGGRLGSCDVAQLLGVGGLDDAVEEPGRVLELLDQVLVVGLEGLEGAIERQKCQFLVVDIIREPGRGDVRRSHVLALGDQLGEFQADLGVVDDGGCLAWKRRRLLVVVDSK
jgi:hypothetical protein